jgi:hypothetical protein
MQAAFPLADANAMPMAAAALVAPAACQYEGWRQCTPPGMPKSTASAVAVPFLRPG